MDQYSEKAGDKPFTKPLPQPLNVPHLHLYTKDIRALLPRRRKKRLKEATTH